MIDFVEGTIAYIHSDYVVVETGGIGYRVFTSNPYAFVQHEGSKRRFYTHHHVREDAIHLYGFATADERNMYRLLLDVTGIGPKGALAVLAAASPDQIVLAVQQENLTYLTKFPGIGKKTAQRMILDLKDKLRGYTPSLAIPVDAAPLTQRGAQTEVAEALEALAALGYSEMELLQVKGKLNEHSQAGASVEQLVKIGLTELVRG